MSEDIKRIIQLDKGDYCLGFRTLGNDYILLSDELEVSEENYPTDFFFLGRKFNKTTNQWENLYKDELRYDRDNYIMPEKEQMQLEQYLNVNLLLELATPSEIVNREAEQIITRDSLIFKTLEDLCTRAKSNKNSILLKLNFYKSLNRLSDEDYNYLYNKLNS